jgi:hypothetical protein
MLAASKLSPGPVAPPLSATSPIGESSPSQPPSHTACAPLTGGGADSSALTGSGAGLSYELPSMAFGAPAPT